MVVVCAPSCIERVCLWCGGNHFLSRAGEWPELFHVSVLACAYYSKCIHKKSQKEGGDVKIRFGREADSPNLHDIVNVIAHRDKQVKEHLRAALLHLHLHRAAPLEGLAAANDECEVVGAEPRVAGRRVRICEACTAQDRRDIDAGLQALLPKSETLEFRQREALRGAVDGCIPEDIVTHAVMVDYCRLVEADEFLFGGGGVVRAGCHCQIRSAGVLERPRATSSQHSKNHDRIFRTCSPYICLLLHEERSKKSKFIENAYHVSFLRS